MAARNLRELNHEFKMISFLPDFFEFIIFIPAVQMVGYRLLCL